MSNKNPRPNVRMHNVDFSEMFSLCEHHGFKSFFSPETKTGSKMMVENKELEELKPYARRVWINNKTDEWRFMDNEGNSVTGYGYDALKIHLELVSPVDYFDKLYTKVGR